VILTSSPIQRETRGYPDSDHEDYCLLERDVMQCDVTERGGSLLAVFFFFLFFFEVIFNFEGGSNTFIRRVFHDLPDYTATQPRTQRTALFANFIFCIEPR
jgi:hypothetical protein